MLQSPPLVQPDLLNKGTYFSSNGRLYYIMDVMPDKDFFLVEDCLTLNSRWMGEELIGNLDKEVINC